MKENITNGIIATASAAVCAYLGLVAVPVIILIACMVLDYITGIAKACSITKGGGGISSRTGIKGIIKKLCYLVAVCAGFGVDWVLHTVLAQVGVTYNISFAVGMFVIIWLIINELISILENLAVIGVPLPTFLGRIAKRLKVVIEKKAEEKTNTIEEKISVIKEENK